MFMAYLGMRIHQELFAGSIESTDSRLGVAVYGNLIPFIALGIKRRLQIRYCLFLNLLCHLLIAIECVYHR